MQFRILGPLEVADGDSVIPLPGTKQRALLALLLLNANEVVSADRLIDELWGDDAPGSGRSALQVRVSQLRKALGATGSQIVTRAPGYVLRLDAEQLDLSRFERLVAEAAAAPPSVATAKLREALALWRGPPLADLAYEAFAQPAIARLEELRLAAIESRVDADLALGRHAEVVAELEALVREHPVRENPRAQLMLALYRSGRQADALAVYQSVRRALVDELAIEPGLSLRELEQAILRQDPSLQVGGADALRRPAPPVVAPVPPDIVEPRHNLPAQTSSFVGRAGELDELVRMLSGARLVTLTGAGGVGKTRLAIGLANRVLDARSDGIWFVDLAPLSDPTLVTGKLASVVEVTELPGRSQQESLVASLRSREILLILDNCEHLIDAAATLAESLLGGCPRITIVATSREPLRIAGELVYRVPSLSLPPIDAPDSDCLADSEAVQLFLDRARQQRPDFALGPDNCATVARLCHRLDGIPLAIELATARLRAITLTDIENRLDDRFGLLTGGNRTALPRQQTLHALIDWSYDLLNPSEQAVLERLSVFAGGFDLESAEFVASCGHDAHVLDEVVALLDKSLIQWDETNGRYRLLESVRDFGAEKLLARSPEAATATRMTHRDHYLELAETAAFQLNRRGQREWLDRLELELDNLRGAISESLSDPDPEPALRLTHALRYFWAYRQPRAEGVQDANAALDRTDARAPTLLRGRALTAGSHLLASITAEYEAATGRAQEALAIARALPDEHLRADALCRLLAIGVYRGDEEAHQSLAVEAQRAARAVGDPQLTATVLLEASSAVHVSDAERMRALEEALVLLREVGDQVLYVRTLSALGYASITPATSARPGLGWKKPCG